jgi:hypothetical protein
MSTKTPKSLLWKFSDSLLAMASGGFRKRISLDISMNWK